MKELKKLIKVSTLVIGLSASIVGFEALATESNNIGNTAIVEVEKEAPTELSPIERVSLDDFDYIGYYNDFEKVVKDSKAKKEDDKDKDAHRQAKLFCELIEKEGNKGLLYIDYYVQSIVDMGMSPEKATQQADLFIGKLRKTQNIKLSNIYAQAKFLCPDVDLGDEELMSVEDGYCTAKETAKEKESVVYKDSFIKSQISFIIQKRKLTKDSDLRSKVKSKLLEDGLSLGTVENYLSYYDVGYNFDGRKSPENAMIALNYIRNGGNSNLVKEYLSEYIKNEEKESDLLLKEGKAVFSTYGLGKHFDEKAKAEYIKRRQSGQEIEISYAYASFDGNECKLDDYIREYDRVYKETKDPIKARLFAICLIDNKDDSFRDKFIENYRTLTDSVKKSGKKSGKKSDKKSDCEFLKISNREIERRAYLIANSNMDVDRYSKYEKVLKSYKAKNVDCVDEQANMYVDLVLVDGESEDFAEKFVNAYFKAIRDGNSAEDAKVIAVWTMYNNEDAKMPDNFLSNYKKLIKFYNTKDIKKEDKYYNTYLGTQWICSGGREDLVERYIDLYKRLLSEIKDSDRAKLEARYRINGNELISFEQYLEDYSSQKSKGDLFAHGYAICSNRYPDVRNTKVSSKVFSKFADEFKNCIESGKSWNYAECYAECILGKMSPEKATIVAEYYDQARKNSKYDKHNISKEYAFLKEQGKDDVFIAKFMKHFIECIDKDGFEVKKARIVADMVCRGKTRPVAEKYANIYFRVNGDRRVAGFIMRGGNTSASKDYIRNFEDGLKKFEGDEIRADMYAMVIFEGKGTEYATVFANAYRSRLDESLVGRRDIRESHIIACAYAEYVASGKDMTKVEDYVKHYVQQYKKIKSEDGASAFAMRKLFNKNSDSIASGIKVGSDMYRDWVF